MNDNQTIFNHINQNICFKWTCLVSEVAFVLFMWVKRQTKYQGLYLCYKFKLKIHIIWALRVSTIWFVLLQTIRALNLKLYVYFKFLFPDTALSTWLLTQLRIIEPKMTVQYSFVIVCCLQRPLCAFTTGLT